jgi:hypothetical protein
MWALVAWKRLRAEIQSMAVTMGTPGAVLIRWVQSRRVWPAGF